MAKPATAADSFGHMGVYSHGVRDAAATAGSVSSRAVQPILAGLRAAGVDAGPVLDALGIDAATLVDPDGRVRHETAVALWRAAERATGDPCFGLRVAELVTFDTFDVQAYAFRASPTLGDGLARLARYQRLNHDTARVEVEVDGDRVRLRHQIGGGEAPAPRAIAEFVLGALIRAVRMGTGAELRPLEVTFAHAPPPPSGGPAHRAVFGIDPRFRQPNNALVFAADILAWPMRAADRGLLSILDRHGEALLRAAPEPASTTASRVRLALAELLRDGREPTAEAVARALGSSVRTVARRLSGEGTSHAKVLAGLRRELAEHWLADPRMGITEVAFLLGYADASAFHRAFRRWTGSTPTAWRAEALPRV